MTIGWNLFIPNQMHKIINKLACLAGAAQLLVLSTHAFADEVATAVPATAAVAPSSAPAPGARPGMLETVTPFILMFGVMYFLILRPQQKKMKDQQSMIAALAVGDSVVTTAGILGVIRALESKVVTLEIANNVQVKMLRSQVSQKLKDGTLDA